MLRKLLIVVCIFAAHIVTAQQLTTLEGYVFESKNRGYLNQVRVMVLDSKTGIVKAEAETDPKGFFTVEVPGDAEYRIGVTKNMFLPKDETVFVKNGEKAFAKLQMDRKPGYLMDVTLAEKRIADMIPTDGLTGVRFEVYNNTTGQEVVRNDSTSNTNILFQMEQGNHYTYLVRKKGYFSKRIEAYVNVKGCILCIDGIDKVTPGVQDNLTQGFKEGVLLANLELQPLKVGSAIKINNIYYDLGSAALRPESRSELDKLIIALRDNPYINVELGSHTDARGDLASNLNLSQRRAESVVEYLIRVGKIDAKRLTAQGYGESKLTNRCLDGIQCSEDEHQVNRRTELKILSIDEDKIMENSLAEIIRQEKMEKEIESISTKQTTEVKEGEDMPDDLKRYIEEQKKAAQKSSTSEPVKNENPRVEFKKEQTKVDTKSKVKEETKEAVKSEVKKVEEAKSNEVKKVEIVKEKIATETVKTEIATEKKIEESPSKSMTEKSKMVTEKEVKTPNVARKVQTLPANYSGYMIEVLSNPKPLSGTNEIFTRFDNITINVEGKETIYYAGNFKNLVDADDFLKNEVATRYPKAKIIRFAKGVKVK